MEGIRGKTEEFINRDLRSQFIKSLIVKGSAFQVCQGQSRSRISKLDSGSVFSGFESIDIVLEKFLKSSSCGQAKIIGRESSVPILPGEICDLVFHEIVQIHRIIAFSQLIGDFFSCVRITESIRIKIRPIPTIYAIGLALIVHSVSHSFSLIGKNIVQGIMGIRA